MSLDLKEAGLSDINELAEIIDKAYAEDALLPQLLPSVHTNGRCAFWAGWLRGDFSKPGEKLFKIVQSSFGFVSQTPNLPVDFSSLTLTS